MKKYAFLLFILFIGLSTFSQSSYAGWKTKAAITAGVVIAKKAAHKCLLSQCSQKIMIKLENYLKKNPAIRQKILTRFQHFVTDKYSKQLANSPQVKQRYSELVKFIRGSQTRKSGVPDSSFKPKKDIKEPYKRSNKAGPFKDMKDDAQGKPCVDCGTITKKQVADHIDPLVVEYYRTGKNDFKKQGSVDAVQAHCPSCSRKQGGQLSQFSRRMKKELFGGKDGSN